MDLEPVLTTTQRPELSNFCPETRGPGKSWAYWINSVATRETSLDLSPLSRLRSYAFNMQSALRDVVEKIPIIPRDNCAATGLGRINCADLASSGKSSFSRLHELERCTKLENRAEIPYSTVWGGAIWIHGLSAGIIGIS